MRRRVALLIVAVFALAGCIPLPFDAGSNQSHVVGVTYPPGNTYDWLWVSLDDATALDIMAKLNVTGYPEAWIETRACFPRPATFRLVATMFSYPNPIGTHLEQEVITHTAVTDPHCSVWIPVGYNGGALPPRPLGGIGGGEVFTIQMRVWPSYPGYPTADIVTGIGAVVATGDGHVWYTF